MFNLCQNIIVGETSSAASDSGDSGVSSSTGEITTQRMPSTVSANFIDKLNQMNMSRSQTTVVNTARVPPPPPPKPANLIKQQSEELYTRINRTTNNIPPAPPIDNFVQINHNTHHGSPQRHNFHQQVFAQESSSSSSPASTSSTHITNNSVRTNMR